MTAVLLADAGQASAVQSRIPKPKLAFSQRQVPFGAPLAKLGQPREAAKLNMLLMQSFCKEIQRNVH